MQFIYNCYIIILVVVYTTYITGCNKSGLSIFKPEEKTKMKDYDVSKIRNIALAGHNGSGKTSLAEALLYKAGATDRLGKTADGTTVCDYFACCF